jgi:hypothetical protein
LVVEDDGLEVEDEMEDVSMQVGVSHPIVVERL